MTHRRVSRNSQEGGGPKSGSLFFLLLFNIFRGGPAQKLAGKITFSTKKVANYSLNICHDDLFFLSFFSISRGWGQAPWAPPGHAPDT